MVTESSGLRAKVRSSRTGELLVECCPSQVLG